MTDPQIKMCKYVITIIATLTILQGGIGDSRLSLLGEARGGVFRPDAPNFAKIYGSDDKMLPVLAFGIGYKDVYMVARYRLFEASGQSLVAGIDLAGTAEWREEIITLGLRTYEFRPLYFELAYALGFVEESISTEQPEYSALNRTFITKDNQGLSAAIGLTIKLITGIYLTGELEYIYIPINSEIEAGNEKVNLGGPSFSIGLSLVL